MTIVKKNSTVSVITRAIQASMHDQFLVLHEEHVPIGQLLSRGDSRSHFTYSAAAVRDHHVVNNKCNAFAATFPVPFGKTVSNAVD